MSESYKRGSIRLSRLVFRRGAFSEILNGSAAQAEVGRQSDRIKRNANALSSGRGAHYDNAPLVQKGKRRVHSIVYTADYQAMADNYKNNTLLRALGGKAAK